VGEDNGTISRFDSGGKLLWSHTIPYETVSWAHWSEKRSCIREISSADINGDGEEEVLLSNGDARVYAFTGVGEMLWRYRVKWGVFNAMTPTTHQGRFALFGGTREPTLKGRFMMISKDGQHVGKLNCGTMESQRFRDVRHVDLDGDGTKEILCTRDINNRQLTCCDAQCNPRWEADVGGSPTALAVREVAGKAQVLCASLSGYLHAFDGVTGKSRWFCYLGDDARILWPQADGTILAACPSGNVLKVGADGALLGRESLRAPVTALLRHGEHRVRPAALPVGTADGTLRVLPRQTR
jgi:outer membrane protein assembly factor BamB